jgi:hypothetical protein
MLAIAGEEQGTIKIDPVSKHGEKASGRDP